MHRLWMTLAGLLGALGVAVAAWSAHGLRAIVAADQLAVAVERAQTANHYLMLHTLALLGVAVASRAAPSRWLDAAGGLFVAGIAAFAGGLYVVRIVAGIHAGPLVAIVPIGGVCLILGWLAVAAAGLRWR